jgi:hypothetical protein
MARDGGVVLSLNAEVDGNIVELHIVTKPNQGIENAVNQLVNARFLTKNGNKFTLQILIWCLNKAKANVIWENFEKLRGIT